MGVKEIMVSKYYCPFYLMMQRPEKMMEVDGEEHG